MNLQAFIDLIPKVVRLLADKNTYYVLFMACLAFWLWKDEQKITAFETEKKKTDSIHLVKLDVLQAKIDNKDCAEEVRAYDRLLRDMRSETSQESDKAAKALELEKKRTAELNQAYQFFKSQ